MSKNRPAGLLKLPGAANLYINLYTNFLEILTQFDKMTLYVCKKYENWQNWD